MGSFKTAAKNRAIRTQLQKARIAAGLTQAQVADRLGRAQTFVSKYELGERRLDVGEFVAVCEVLDISALDLIRGIVGSHD